MSSIHIYEDKNYEFAVRDLKAAFFNVVSVAEENRLAIEEMINVEENEELKKRYKELADKQFASSQYGIGITNELISSIEELDICAKSLRQMEDEKKAKLIASTTKDTKNNKEDKKEKAVEKEESLIEKEPIKEEKIADTKEETIEEVKEEKVAEAKEDVVEEVKEEAVIDVERQVDKKKDKFITVIDDDSVNDLEKEVDQRINLINEGQEIVKESNVDDVIKTKYIKSSEDLAKAIIVVKNQFKNLAKSRPTQKALVDARESVGSTVIDSIDATEKIVAPVEEVKEVIEPVKEDEAIADENIDLEKMSERVLELYKSGNVKEAEALSERITMINNEKKEKVKQMTKQQ